MLHVWLRAQHSPLAIWQDEHKQWQTYANWQQLQEAYASLKGSSAQTICLYFPSSNMLQVDTELSSAQLKQLGTSGKQYLFEETSLTPVEQLVIRQVNQANSQASSHYLYAIAQSDIEMWQQSAALADLTITALLPDFLLLPTPEEGAGQQITLYQDVHTTLLRQSLRQGMAVSYLPLIFERLTHLSEVCLLQPISSDTLDSADLDKVDRVDTLDSHSAVLSESSMNLDKQAPSPNNLAAQTAATLAAHQLLLTPLNALPHPVDMPERHNLNFFTKSSNSQLSPYLRVAILVALCALVLQIATDSVQWYQYQTASEATESAIAAQYQSWFPNETLSPRTKMQVQVAPKLRDTQASSAHLAVLARIAPLIKQSSLNAQALVMQPSALSFTLIAPDRSSLDDFTSTLSAQGLSANLERVNGNEQGQFSGQVIVSVNEDTATSASDL